VSKQSKSIYKYRSGGIDSQDLKTIFERDLKSLVNNEIYAATIKNLNDPCEGLISTDILMAQIDEMLKKNPQAIESMSIFKNELNNMLSHIDTSGIYSLSKNYLNELLWAHYANSHKGFCIEYDLDILLKLNNERTDINKNQLVDFDVIYNDKPYYLKSHDMNNLVDTRSFMSKLLGYKSKNWKYEDEIRIICSQSGCIEYDYRAVKSIYFGLRMEEEQEIEIMKSLQGRGINYYKIQLKNNSYKFYAELIQDKYQTDKNYLYSIAPIPEYIIKHTNYESNNYIRKAIEIVRREPHCNTIANIKENEDNIEIFFFKELPIIFKQKYTYHEIDKLFNDIDDLDMVDILK